MGREISGMNVPTLLVQEGGYYVDDLGKMADSFLQGITQK
jgi:acetoin utilization deacetylase AcuC-like enzyme